MKINEFDFESIEQIIIAAKNLQWAGKKDDCKRILEQLANELLEKKLP